MQNLVLIPGMMCDARLFAPQISALSHCCSIQLATPYYHASIDQMAEQILANAPPKFALAGLSMGGIVAMEVVAKAPDRVTHLALMNTNAKAELEEAKLKREPQVVKAKSGKLLSVMHSEMIPNYFPDTSTQCPKLMQLCEQMAVDLGVEVFVNQSFALKNRKDQQEALRQVKAPTLILCGKEDKLCPVDRHQRIKELIPHATLTIIDSAGHLSTLQQPDVVNGALLLLLKQNTL